MQADGYFRLGSAICVVYEFQMRDLRFMPIAKPYFHASTDLAFDNCTSENEEIPTLQPETVIDFEFSHDTLAARRN